MKNLAYIWILSLFIFSCGGGNEGKPDDANETKTEVVSSDQNDVQDESEDDVLAENTDDESEKDEEPVDVDEKKVYDDNSAATTSTTEHTKEVKHTTSENKNAESTKEELSKKNKTTTNDTKTAGSTKTGGTTKSGGATKSGGTKPNPTELSHDVWNRLLEKYVSASGKVNYLGLKAQKSVIDGYLTHLGIHPPKASWSKEKEMAYWINMYNAFTISLILNKYPINSIMELRGGKVWMTEQILVAGKPYTLEQIEKEMLLGKFKDPRIHFAVNCAAKSCPPLHNGAWTEANIQKLLDKKASAFINNPDYNTISKKKVTISKIFEWYAADFGGKDNLVNYLNKYSNIPIKSGASVNFHEYNWDLNK